ncbi:MAG: CHAT domain-containing protein [Acidobacteriota bacterium]
MTSYARTLILTALINFGLGASAAIFSTQIEDPLRLLEEADRLAWIENRDKAGPLYERAERLFAQAGNERNTLAARIGKIQAGYQSQYLPDLAERLAEELEGPILRDDAQLRLRWLVTRAEVAMEIDPPAAQQVWEEVRKTAAELGHQAWEARAQGRLGYIAFFQGDIYKTQELMREALYAAQSLGDVGAQIWYLTSIGGGLGELELHDQSLKFVDEAFRLAEAHPDAGFPYRALAVKARSLGELKHRSEARKLLDKGLKELHALNRRLDESWCLTLSGRLSASEGNLRFAIAQLEAARKLCEEGGFHHTLAWSMFELARVYRDQGDLQKAEERARLALTAMRKVQDKYHLPQHLALLAELAARRGRFREADQLLEQAGDVTEAMLANVPSTFGKTSLIGTMSAIYVGHFVLAVEYLKDKRRAFEILERARGRAAADIIRSHPFRSRTSDERTKTLEKEISQLQTRLQFGDLSNRQVRDQLLDQLWRSKEQLNSIPEPRTPFQESTIHGRPVSVSELQKTLRPDEALLEYVLSEPASYCIVVTPEAFDMVILAGRRRIEALIDTYLSHVRSLTPGRELSQQLYRLLLRAPLAGRRKIKRLTIVPDGKLHLLPFDSLIDSGGQYALENHTFSVVPSATVYHLLNGSVDKARCRLPFLGVGGVPYGEQNAGTANPVSASILLRGISDLDFSRLPPLPGSQEEITAVSRIVGDGSVSLVGSNASKATFLSQDLSGFAVLHFAVHAVSDATFPDRSSLVLWRDPNSELDGLLQERDIRYLDLGADLVVLSACDTSVGRLQGQEGMISLVRAFFYAGARTVVASLWEASDAATKELMSNFYRHLMAGQEKAVALRKAKLDLMQKFGSDAPVFHWAGAVAYGEGNSPVRLPAQVRAQERRLLLRETPTRK